MTSRIGRHLVDILHRSPPIVDFLRLEPSPSTLPPHTHTEGVQLITVAGVELSCLPVLPPPV